MGIFESTKDRNKRINDMTESLVITKIIEIQEIESSRVDTLQKCVGNLTDQVSMLKNMVAAQEENFNKLMETL